MNTNSPETKEHNVEPVTTPFEAFAFDGTKSRRRDHRRSVRNTLGVSHQGAPHVWQALRATDDLSEILRLASGGRFMLTVFDAKTGTYITLAAAKQAAREASNAGRESL